MRFKIAQVIGLNTDQKAAQVSSSIREEDNIFLAVLDLSSDDAFTRGRQLLNELSDSFFDEEESPAVKLNNVFALAKKKLEDVTEFNVLLAAVSGKALYLLSTNNISAFLKRDTNLSSLLVSGNPEQLISGFLQEGDRVFLSTNSLVDLLGQDLKGTLNLALDEWEETISAKVGGENTDSQGLAGLILEAEIGEVEKPAIPNIIDNLDSKIDIKPKSLLAPFLTLLNKKTNLDEAGGQPYYNQPVKKRSLVNIFSRVFPKSGKGKLVLGLILILIIALGAGYKYKLKKDEESLNLFNQYITSAQDNFNNAQNIQTLNALEAKSKLDLAKQDLGKALLIRPNDPKALDLKNKLNQNSGQILQQYSTNFSLFLDLDLIKKGFSSQNLSLSDGKLLMLDTASQTLVSVDLAKKSQQILAGKDALGDGQASSVNGGLAFVYSKDKGIIRIDITNQKAISVSKKDSEWGNIVNITGFGSNVYLLDSAAGKIWKYLPTETGYSDKREYLSSGVKADLSGSIRMQIESSVYILKQGGEMLRFTKGASDFFSIGGLDKGIKNPKSFFVSSDTDNLYILDSGNSRLVVVNKTGGYQAQYQGDKFASSSDLVVDEKAKKVYLLDAGKIYTADLK